MRVLEVSASGRRNGSVSRMLSAEIVEALEIREGDFHIDRRDLSQGVSAVNEAWIDANFTPEEERTADQQDALRESDALVAELQSSDVIVIGSPIYNFGIPAALKAWIDMVARARLTFRYKQNGPEGLLKNKKAYIVIASGGVPVGSAIDFATPYLRHALAFIGITDVDIIAADRLNSAGEESIDAARVQIANLVHTSRLTDNRAA
jgi:FMN-dependent NADH-azoreductase